MRNRPEALMLFAAGFGTRMGALTAARPKPLIEVAGKPLIDHALDLVRTAGIGRVVVNLHYLGDQLAVHLESSGVLLSWERARILDTGGGLRAALPLLGPGPVFTLNSDAIWTGGNPLDVLAKRWAPGTGALLLLAPAARVHGRQGSGDFTLHPDGRISRGGDHVYLGAQIIDPAGLAGIPDTVFSLNRVWDRLIAEGRAQGCVFGGGWCDVGHPAGIAEAEALLQEARDV